MQIDQMPEAFSTRGWQRIKQLAQSEPDDAGSLRFKLYVIEISPTDPTLEYEFYVGSTRISPEYRLKQHQSRGDRAARMFRNERARAVRLRPDLMAGLPKFRTKAAAEAAEGTLARVISCNIGPAYSDQRNKRQQGSRARVATSGS
jgi:hypothetical protein